MSALTEFLFPAPAPRSVDAIVGWWERRRLFFNLSVGGAGLLSFSAITVVASLATGEIVVPWQGAVLFGVMANVCYLLGPVVEILVHQVWGRTVLPIGPALYRMGLTFSVGLALLPTLLAGFLVVARVVLSLLG